MRTYSAAELAALQTRGGYVTRALLWLQVRDRATNARVGFGFWTGEDDRNFTIGAETRAYEGGGALVSVDPIVMQSGLTVRMQRVTLSPLFADVNTMLRGYDAWRAPAEIHRVFFNPESGGLIANPKRLWKGVVDGAPIQTPAIGGESNVVITLASALESLTHGLTMTRSDAVQRQRGDDRFYRYKDMSGSVSTSWGEKRFSGAPAAPVVMPSTPGRGSDR